MQHLSHVQWSFLFSSLLLLCPQALPTNPKALLRATPENRERERVRNSWRNGQRWTNTSTTRRKATRKKFTQKQSTCKYVQMQVLQLVFFRFTVTMLLKAKKTLLLSVPLTSLYIQVINGVFWQGCSKNLYYLNRNNTGNNCCCTSCYLSCYIKYNITR